MNTNQLSTIILSMDVGGVDELFHLHIMTISSCKCVQDIIDLSVI